VIFDVQRVGPSTGMPTRTMQGDILTCATLSHGDTKHIMLLPASVAECFSLAGEAFDLAERFQTPVFVMSDLDLGMNNWMSQPFTYPERPLDRGKVLSADELKKLGEFARYKDVDGDGIGYRTLPGTDHPKAAYFTRGSGHNEKAQYSERPDDYQHNMERLAKKFESARSAVPKPEVVANGTSKIGVIAYGSTDFAMRESQSQLEREFKLPTDYLRLRAYPFSREVHDFVKSHERVYVVEQNRDAQMLQLIKLDVDSSQVPKLRSVLHFNGLPIDARSITDEIISQEGR
jgi:2-oxoglutarate/2-oxoacid ferredoxin oxidoreductase subunit alpha